MWTRTRINANHADQLTRGFHVGSLVCTVQDNLSTCWWDKETIWNNAICGRSCEDFRGIAISPIISKLFEYCLNAKFTDDVDEDED